MEHDPQYFDLQVNGYGGVDFNSDELTDADFHGVCTRLASEGVEGILATITTDCLDCMVSRIGRIVRACNEDAIVGDMIRGIHLEGPFINETPGYVGAHSTEAVRPADVETMLSLLDAGEGSVRIVTLAPERDDHMKVTRRLTAEGVVVSAGHTDVSREGLLKAIDAGLSMFTHLGNGCPRQLDRHDNIVQRVLSMADHLWCCFIADGIHIPFYALKNYLKVTGIARAIIVTDAIAAAGLGAGQYSVGGRLVDVDQQGVTTFACDTSHLVGSAVTMAKSAVNLRQDLGLSGSAIRRLTSQNPKQAIAAF